MTHALTRAAGPLVARTRLIPDGEAFDPFDHLDDSGFAWWHGDAGFVASGVATRVRPDRVRSVLAAIAVDDEVRAPGTGAMAVGALAYADPVGGPGADVVVPDRVVGRTPDGRAFVTVLGVTPDDVPAGVTMDVPAVMPEPTEFRVSRGMSRSAWHRAVGSVLACIAAGDVDKVVLARDVAVDADRPFDRARIARRLRAAHPDCFVFAADGFVGASPELLVSRHERELRARPLAGTSPSADAAGRARLGASDKDRWEHQIVIDSMTAVFARLGVSVNARGPQVVRFGELAHLATEITGTLPPGVEHAALDLACALHPTPAVGGSPASVADRLIAELEPTGRGRYAAPVGWVDATGDGEWAIALRSAEINGARAVLRAGAGIVAGSEPTLEWDETEAKLAPMLAALVCP